MCFTKTSSTHDFLYQFVSASQKEYDRSGDMITFTNKEYYRILRSYDECKICDDIYDENTLRSHVLDYGFVRNKQVYDGSLFFQEFKEHVYSDEEKEALMKLGRVYDLIIGKYLSYELNNLFVDDLSIVDTIIEDCTYTGILNKEDFKKKVCYLNQEKYPMAFMIIEVNNFKEIMEQFGNEVTNQILTQISKLLNNHFRSTDIAMHFGEDQFAVLLKNIKLEQKDFIVRKIDEMNEILAHYFNDVSVSLNAGVSFSKCGYNDQLYIDAHKALYQMKEKGMKGCYLLDTE